VVLAVLGRREVLVVQELQVDLSALEDLQALEVPEDRAVPSALEGIEVQVAGMSGRSHIHVKEEVRRSQACGRSLDRSRRCRHHCRYCPIGSARSYRHRLHCGHSWWILQVHRDNSEGRYCPDRSAALVRCHGYRLREPYRLPPASRPQ
jgi:hypothetical protein